jgi:hypothetical protein
MPSPPETHARSGKRKLDRASRRIPVKYGEARPDKTGYANNVSPDGLYLQGARFKAGTLLFVEAQVKEQTFMLMAQVRWTTHPHPVLVMSAPDRGVGLRILNPSPEWEAAIAGLRSVAA